MSEQPQVLLAPMPMAAGKSQQLYCVFAENGYRRMTVAALSRALRDKGDKLGKETAYQKAVAYALKKGASLNGFFKHYGGGIWSIAPYSEYVDIKTKHRKTVFAAKSVTFHAKKPPTTPVFLANTVEVAEQTPQQQINFESVVKSKPKITINDDDTVDLHGNFTREALRRLVQFLEGVK